MLISSGTGMILDKGVAKYRGFALLAISRTGLTGSIGAIHANRLTTALHTQLASTSKPRFPSKSRSNTTPHSKLSTTGAKESRSGYTSPDQLQSKATFSTLQKSVFSNINTLNPVEYGLALFILGFPMQGMFLWFVKWAGWIDLSLGWSGWVTFGITVS
jgi:solute carrier family 41